MSRVRAVVSDFGGVLTTPLLGSFEAFHDASGVSPQELWQAIAALAMDRGANPLGANPLFELETGRLSEAEFLDALGEQLSVQLGREVSLDGFGEAYFAHLAPNDRLIAYLRELSGRGYRLAICTNNVREWESRWRAMLPVDEIFDVVVDSSAVGARKPEPRIYELTLQRLDVRAADALLIDDIDVNCRAARELGMQAVWFQSTDQAIAETETALRDAA